MTKIEELEQAKLEPKPPEQHGVIFLPFVRMKSGHTVAGIEFLPLRDGQGKVPQILESAVASIDQILSGYVDRHGKPFTNCVVATIPSKGWDLSEDDFPTVLWAASLLFLASWACNDYLRAFGGAYVNSSNFRVVGQRFKGPSPTYISISARRRDGHSMDGGYKHGELKFTLPVQCSARDPATVDEAFLKALDASNAADADVIGRLRTSLPFVQLANTDDDVMMEHAEAILMGSAFEQLLRGDASAYKLGKRFGDLFGEFGSVTVADAQKARTNIQIDAGAPGVAAADIVDAQGKWWVHRKWIEELYDVRSKMVHNGSHVARPWGWNLFEHLVMAAHLFPLSVKLLLAADGRYQISDSDRVHCLAVDRLLSSTQWVEDRDTGEDSPGSWTAITSKIRRDLDWNRAWEAVKKKYPDVFGKD